MSETDKLLYRSDWELKKSLKSKGSPVPKCTGHTGPTRANRTMPCPSLTTALGSRGTWRKHQSTWPISGWYPRPNLDTNLLWKRSIDTFCASCATFQKIHTATRADFPVLAKDCETAHLSELKDWHVWTSESPVPPPRLSLRATAALRKQRISPKTYYTVITHKQTWKLFAPNGPDLQSTGTSQLLLMKCNGGAMKSHGILEYTDIPTCQGRGNIKGMPLETQLPPHEVPPWILRNVDLLVAKVLSKKHT